MKPADKTKKTRQQQTPRRLLLAAVVLVAAVVAIYLLVNVYVTKGMTWAGIFERVGLGPDGTVDYTSPGQLVTLADGEVAVHLLYVGQADCTVIRAGGSVVMIDAGDWYSKDTIFGFLDSYGIERIDHLFLTHPHTDHMGSMADIVRRYAVGQVYFTNHPDELTPTNSTYTNLLETLLDTQTPTKTVASDMVVELDLGAITVVYDPINNDLNNCSMVLRYEYGDTAFLFMGDAENTVEYQMLDYGLARQADVLKVGHHGTKKATTAQFLQAVKPDYAVVSCGIDNDYGYPKDEVLQRLDDAGATVLRTDTMGEVAFVSDGGKVALWQPKQEAA